MSTEFERLLREARRALPVPGDAATRRARSRALAAVRRRRLRRPAAVVLAVALVAVGVAIGALVTPSGSAAPAPTGLGFLPAPGWSVLQNGGDGTPVRPAVAIAANVELSPDDDPDGLPLSTLEALPPGGVVIVAGIVARGEAYYDEDFPTQALPLNAAAAERGIQYGVQIRPDRPLGEYQLRAGVNGYDVDVNIYYGTYPPTPAAVAAAQHQLDHLVVQQPRTPAQGDQPLARPRSASQQAVSVAEVIDRTIECTPGSAHGARSITVDGKSGFRRDGKFEWLAQFTVSTPGNPVPSSTDYMPQLAGVTAGFPFNSPMRTGEMGFSPKLCRPARAQVPLTTQGLWGGVAGQFDDQTTCLVSGPVLIRVRTSFFGPTTLKTDRRRTWYSADARIARAQVAVRTSSGEALAYGEVLDSGKARLFTSGRCG